MSNSIVLKTTLTSGVVIREDEKTGMYNLTEMFDSANDTLGTNRQIKHYLESKGCQELLNHRANLIKSHQRKIGDGENQQLTKEQEKEIRESVLKVYRGKMTKDGKTKNRVMADPVMALDAASYIDVALKNDVYEYYLDGKINERRKVKEQYKLMCEALYSLSKEQSIFPYAVQQINSIVFDRGIGGLWNDETTKEQLQETYKIMVMITELINDGYIDTLSKLRKKFDSMYVKKYGEHKFEPCTTVE